MWWFTDGNVPNALRAGTVTCEALPTEPPTTEEPTEEPTSELPTEEPTTEKPTSDKPTPGTKPTAKPGGNLPDTGTDPFLLSALSLIAIVGGGMALAMRGRTSA